MNHKTNLKTADFKSLQLSNKIIFNSETSCNIYTSIIFVGGIITNSFYKNYESYKGIKKCF